MNIFVTDPDPLKSALGLDDKRVNKMILESAQILSTVMWKAGYEGPYRPTHKNHPCVIWASEPRFLHATWLLEHFYQLGNLYTKKSNRTHKSLELYGLFRLFFKANNFQSPRYFENCTLFKDESCVFTAYKKHLIHKWNHDKLKPTWNHGIPAWKEQLK